MGEYRDVLLTLSHVILPPEKLYPQSTPSMNEGLPWDIEYDLRLIGCELIQTACLLLKLPQVITTIKKTNRTIVSSLAIDSRCHWSSSVPSLFLLLVFRSSTDGIYRYGLCHVSGENRRECSTDARRDQCLSPYQTSAIGEVS